MSNRNLSVIVGEAVEEHILKMPCPYELCDGRHSSILVGHILSIINRQPRTPRKSTRIAALKRAHMLIGHHTGHCPATVVAMDVLWDEIKSLEWNLTK